MDISYCDSSDDDDEYFGSGVDYLHQVEEFPYWLAMK